MKFIHYYDTQQGKIQFHKNAQLFEKDGFVKFIQNVKDQKLKSVYQILRKYQHSFKWINQNQMIFQVRITPNVKQNQIRLQEPAFHQGYVIIAIQLGKSISVKNQSLSQELREQFNYQLTSMLQKKQTYDVLKYVQQKFSILVDKVIDKIQAIQIKQKMQRQKTKDIKKQRQEVKNEIPNTDQQHKHQDNSQQQSQQQIQPILLPTHKIVIQQLVEGNYISIISALVAYSCKCSHLTNVYVPLISANLLRSIFLCKMCENQTCIQIQRQMLFKGNNCVGLIGYQGEVQIIGFKITIGCQCGQEKGSDNIVRSGQTFKSKCKKCFTQDTFKYIGIVLQQNKPQKQLKKRMNLPKNGTCGHNRKDYRYYNYTCCKAYPCQQCHKQNQEHQLKKPQAMICGYCSHEQKIRQNCFKCNRQLERGKQKSHHWEGGKGCRQKQFLSKKDKKKYTGLTKTK